MHALHSKVMYMHGKDKKLNLIDKLHSKVLLT